jgi:site-specific DNA-methyltransferase (adenine-specific)
MAMMPYYQDSLVTIYHGDCRDVAEWLDADVMLTDPPYGMAYVSGWKARAIVGDHSTAGRDIALFMWGNRPALVFGRWSVQHPQSTRTVLTWDKGDWPGMGDLALPWGLSTEEIYVIGDGFNGKRAGSVIRVDRLTGETIHPNEKPVALIYALLDKCPPGTVADPFMGSGTTLRAAKDLGRRAIGIEIEERYCEIAAKRMGQEVLALSTGGY